MTPRECTDDPVTVALDFSSTGLAYTPDWITIDVSTGDITVLATTALAADTTVSNIKFTMIGPFIYDGYSFSVIANGCWTPPTMTISQAYFSGLTYVLSSGFAGFDWYPDDYLIDDNALAYCGDYTINVTNGDGSALTGDTIALTTSGYGIDTTDESLVGTHTFAIQVYYTLYTNFKSNIVLFDLVITGSTSCAIGTASYIPDFFYDRDVGDEQSFTF